VNNRPAASALMVTNLSCEYAVNPLGLDTPHPRLSWELVSERRAQFQSAYQIVAATSPDLLKSDAPDLWDSGKITSTSTLVEYHGRALSSGERCWWKVRIWDGEGQPVPDSPTAWFEMALLSPEDWQAAWIGYPGAWPGRALYFRREFTVEKPVRCARVYMAGLGWSELWINGQRANDRVLDPPQSNYSKRILYSTDAVEALLHPGINTINVICGNGWFGMVRLLLQMNITYDDGTTSQVITESDWSKPWRATTGPILENSVYDGEIYDARLEDPNWATPETPPQSWLMSTFAEGPGGKLVAAPLEPIKVVDTRTAKQISQPKPGIYVLDLGQNISGWARLQVRGNKGRRVSLRFAETLHEDGTINQENLRHARAEDVYILKGDGLETWEPRFTYHGFRYIQVEGYPGEPGPEDILGRVVRSAVEPTGSFECSSELLNQIHNMVWWTEAGNLHSLPTDCPQRDERMGWLNDMAARTEESLYNFNLARLLSKWTADIHDEQHPTSGAITDTAPFRWGRRPADPVSVCYLLIPWLLYVHYGDTHTMADRYPGMKAWVDYLSACAEDGIVSYSYYGDWAPPVQYSLSNSIGSSAVSRDTPGALVSTACYAYSASLLAKIATVLDKPEDTLAYTHISEKVIDRYNAQFWDETIGGYGTNNQACNAISLYMGMVPEHRTDQVASNLVDNITQHTQGHLSTGNICTKYLLEALTETGHAETAFQIAAQETYPSWGYMLAHGATTLWERWEFATGGGMNSHNHPMLGSIGAWFYRALAGIRACSDGPGFERFDIRPQVVPDLSFVNATLKTIRGKIETGWQRDNEGTLHFKLVVPAGCQAQVVLPAPTGSVLMEGDVVLWRNETPVKLAAGVNQIAREGSHLRFNLGSGKFHFRAVQP
jgi:alpha-L-rhamnosidase